tara:strand:+ start:330 stop:1502 length:1173 start_codon:yes stop_codon:yes gene_type:complete
MKSSPSSRRGRGSREADLIVELAEGLAQSGSRVEDIFWTKKLNDEIQKNLKSSDETTLNTALDRLAERESRAYEELADAIEGNVEHQTIGDQKELQKDVLLFAVPILAWSRMLLPTKTLTRSQLERIKKSLIGNIFNKNTDVSLADFFYSPDQLPESFGETKDLMTKLTECLPKNNLKIDSSLLNQTAKFLADQRYILGIASVPKGEPIFLWQSGPETRDEVNAIWKKVGKNLLNDLLPACAYELILPRAYYVACRDADKSARKFSITASVSYLSTLLTTSANLLSVVVGGCYNRQLEEYRISFFSDTSVEAIHGVIWPLLGAEDEMSDIVEEIEHSLRDSGVERVEILSQRLPMEYCEECGSPLYPNHDGEMTHTELPAPEEGSSQNLH